MSQVDPAPVPSSGAPAAASGEQQASMVVAAQSVVVSPVDCSGRSRYRVRALQEKALPLLAAGVTIPQTASAIGVSPRTLHRWLQIDSRFAAAVNAWRQENSASGRIRIEALSTLALDAVQGALKKGDARIGLQVARANGLLTPGVPAPTPTSPKEIRRLRRLRKRLQLLRERRQLIKLAEAERKLPRKGDEAKPDWQRDIGEVESYLGWLLELHENLVGSESPERPLNRFPGIAHHFWKCLGKARRLVKAYAHIAPTYYETEKVEHPYPPPETISGVPMPTQNR